jgi:hypothetical protein
MSSAESLRLSALQPPLANRPDCIGVRLEFSRQFWISFAGQQVHHRSGADQAFNVARVDLFCRVKEVKHPDAPLWLLLIGLHSQQLKCNPLHYQSVRLPTSTAIKKNDPRKNAEVVQGFSQQMESSAGSERAIKQMIRAVI